jgi:hypothetical protein
MGRNHLAAIHSNPTDEILPPRKDCDSDGSHDNAQVDVPVPE